MNRNHHRIVFNPARGVLMAVSECARSMGKASACTVTTAAVSMLFCLPLQAQISADAAAPGTQRPTVLNAANGVPLVNITTPSAAGVSRNTYRQFDVGSPGAILNNSRTDVQTRLGGWVQGNPWLAAGPARVILNEVHSSQPSQLNGFVEVGGQRAEVIIANPAGINVNGGGFINASRATLTTGTPVMNAGALEGFRVQGGQVRVEGLGLDASTTDHAAILARAVEVNAGIWANALTVVTGVNDVSADASRITATVPTGAAPAFALDVAALGGMYAGQIRLVGTEAGLGVNQAGTIGASAGNVVIDSNGWLSNSGSIHASDNTVIGLGEDLHNNAGGMIAAQHGANLTARTVNSGADALLAAGLALDGSLSGASASLQVNARDSLTLHGQALSAGEIALHAGDMQLQNATVLAGGALALHANGHLSTAHAELRAGQISAHAHTLDNTAGRISAQGALTLNTGDLVNGVVGGAAGAISSLGALTVHAHTVDNQGGTDGADLPVQATLWSDDAITVHAERLDNAGAIFGSTVHLHTSDQINNTGAGAVFGDHISIATQTLNNRPHAAGGTAPVIAAREQLHLGVQTLNNEDGALLHSEGSMAIGGALNAQLHASGQALAVNNISARIEAIDHLSLSALALINERRDADVTQLQVLDQTTTLEMPTWWVNGKNEHGAAIAGTSIPEVKEGYARIDELIRFGYLRKVCTTSSLARDMRH